MHRSSNIRSLNGIPESEILALAASAEYYSEHPLAEAVRIAAEQKGMLMQQPQQSEAIPGVGVSAVVNGTHVTVAPGQAAAIPQPQFLV